MAKLVKIALKLEKYRKEIAEALSYCIYHYNTP